MKKLRSISVFFVVLALIMQLFCIGASADNEFAFLEQDYFEYTDRGLEVTVMLYGAKGETGDALRAIIEEYEPRMYVSCNDMPYCTRFFYSGSVDGDHAEMKLLLNDSGNYALSFMSLGGGVGNYNDPTEAAESYYYTHIHPFKFKPLNGKLNIVSIFGPMAEALEVYSPVLHMKELRSGPELNFDLADYPINDDDTITVPISSTEFEYYEAYVFSTRIVDGSGDDLSKISLIGVNTYGVEAPYRDDQLYLSYADGYSCVSDAKLMGSKLIVRLKPICREAADGHLAEVAEGRPYVQYTAIMHDGTEIINQELFIPGKGMSTVAIDVSGVAEIHLSIVDDNMAGKVIGGFEDSGYIFLSEPNYVFSCIPESAAPKFSDVPADQWYHSSVYNAAAMGLVNGMGGDRFDPNGSMTYAQAITLAARMHKLYDGGSISDFEATDPWYDAYIDYARENGIPCDYDNLNAPITREEYVHIFYSALPEREYGIANDVADGAIPDIGMDHKYADEIYAFYRAGILNGSDAEGTFNPTWDIKRSEVSAILCRMFGIGRV